MKAIVVGGGLTGCVAALSLARRGFSVSLHEQSPQLGGVLRDHRIGDDFWFNGCQYLSPDAPWLRELRSEVDCEFEEFDHTYGSYTRALGASGYWSEMAAPVVASEPPAFDQALPATGTLADRFSAYGPPVAQALSEIAMRWGHSPESLDTDCAISMQMSRIMLGGQAVDRIRDLKAANATADALLALPRSELMPGGPVLRAALPRRGYDVFFQSLQGLLVARGVTIETSSPMTARASDAGAIVFNRGRAVDADLFTWCCNPVPVVHAAGCGKLDSPPLKMAYLYGRLSGDCGSLPHYVQCFDAASALYRLYCFNSAEGPKICIECFAAGSLDAELVRAEAERVLAIAGRPVRIELLEAQSRTLYVLFTPRDKAMLSDFAVRARARRMVPGAWEVFGRDGKIAAIEAGIQALGSGG